MHGGGKRGPFGYLLSLPERSVRAGVAVAAGALKTAADHLLPRSLRASRSYAITIGRLERFLVETVGDVRGVYDGPPDGAGRWLARKTAGNALELATFVAVGVSPVWFLAMAADLTHGTRVFLEALVHELRREGVALGERDARTVDGLLDALQRSLGAGAETADMPRLDVAGLRASWEAFKASRAPLPEAKALAVLFRDLQATAAATGRSLLAVSSLSGLGALAERGAGGTLRTVRRAGRAAARAFGAPVVEDYRRALAEIRAEGPEAYTARVVIPYVAAVRRHFDPARTTLTERGLRGRGPEGPPPLNPGPSPSPRSPAPPPP